MRRHGRRHRSLHPAGLAGADEPAERPGGPRDHQHDLQSEPVPGAALLLGECGGSCRADLRFICNARWTTGKRIQPWPIQGGVDRSRHVNNPLPVDHFSYRQDRDFFGAHYEKSQLGTYHLAFRHQSGGQKYFSWGMQEDNAIWERFLTDHDGQYIEIQSGLYPSQAVTDWLDAGDSVTFHGSWFGTAGLGPLTWADADVAVAAERHGSDLRLGLFSIGLTGRFLVSVRSGTTGKSHEEWVQLTPGTGRSLMLPLRSATRRCLPAHRGGRPGAARGPPGHSRRAHLCLPPPLGGGGALP